MSHPAEAAPSNIKIDTGIPVPPTRKGVLKYPFRTMKPGDSFFSAHLKLQCQLGRIKKDYGGKWTSRKVTENGVTGIRIWRLE